MRALLILLLLAGCATANSTIPLGGPAEATPGWAGYCSAHPGRTECS